MLPSTAPSTPHTKNDAFNVLLHRLHETASQLAKQHQQDVEAALHENEGMWLTFFDTSTGDIVDDQNGVRATRSESFESLCDAEAHGVLPKECVRSSGQGQALQKPPQIQDPDSLETSISRQITQPRHFAMRSPWIDHRDFDNVKLQDIIPEEQFAACLSGKVHFGHEVEVFGENVHLPSGNLRCSLVHPQSRVRGLWVLACIAFILYDSVMVPLDVCFDLEKTRFSEVMDVAVATFWTMDIVFTFFVGVRQAHALEMRPSKVACLYFKSWFIFDMFIVIPEWVTMAIADGDFSLGEVSIFRFARWGRLVRLLRMARILKLGKLKPVVRRLIYVFNLSAVYIQMVQVLAGLTFAVLGFIHIISCFWYAIGNSSDDGWVAVNGLKSASVGRAYAASLHWTLSRLHGVQTYSELESVNEFIVEAVLIWLSLLLVAFYNGTVAAVAITRATGNAMNLWRVSTQYVMRHKISASLDDKMSRFLECSGAGGARETAAEEHTLLEELPKTLQHDLLFEARVPFLVMKPFLRDLLTVSPRVIYQICNSAVAQKVYVDGEVVFAKGDACHGMVFVTSGVLYYILDIQESMSSRHTALHGAILVAEPSTKQIEAMSSLSEPVLWTHWTHTGSLLTMEESSSLVLSPDGFSHVVAEHTEVLCYACKYAKRFVLQLNKASRYDDLTFYHEISINDLDTDMFEGSEYDHFMFLSHYKVEAGTEATLMRDLFQDILREDPNHTANDLRSPIFVDSEDLTDLSKLKEHVVGSVAFVLLLTPGVLSRPWCLVEIVTAVSYKVNIVPVEIQRPGFKYNYPDERFYSDILDGKLLSQTDVELLEREGISLSDVEQAIRKVFLKIALPFSPHKTKAVRDAELHDILARSSPG